MSIPRIDHAILYSYRHQHHVVPLFTFRALRDTHIPYQELSARFEHSEDLAEHRFVVWESATLAQITQPDSRVYYSNAPCDHA